MSPRGGKRPGSGRPPKYPGGPTTQIPVYIPQDVLAAIDREARSSGRSRSETIVRKLSE